MQLFRVDTTIFSTRFKFAHENIKKTPSKVYSTAHFFLVLPTSPNHTDPIFQIFSKIVLMAKLLQNNLNLNDFEYSRYLKARKIEERQKKKF